MVPYKPLELADCLNVPDEREAAEREATRLKDDLWQFSARVKFGGQEITVPVSIHVRWAGDTPVITLTSPVQTRPGASPGNVWFSYEAVS